MSECVRGKTEREGERNRFKKDKKKENMKLRPASSLATVKAELCQPRHARSHTTIDMSVKLS